MRLPSTSIKNIAPTQPQQQHTIASPTPLRREGAPLRQIQAPLRWAKEECRSRGETRTRRAAHPVWLIEGAAALDIRREWCSYHKSARCPATMAKPVNGLRVATLPGWGRVAPRRCARLRQRHRKAACCIRKNRGEVHAHSWLRSGAVCPHLPLVSLPLTRSRALMHCPPAVTYSARGGG